MHIRVSQPELMMNQNLAALVFLLGRVPYVLAEDENEEEGENEWKNYWIAHGVCASFAWAIIVPLAIGSALLRKKFVGETWFQIHRLLNGLAAILTVVAFGIAVYVIREEDNHLGRSTFISLLA
jgi:cytochrome bd-type quinol oxidase subunit 2